MQSNRVSSASNPLPQGSIPYPSDSTKQIKNKRLHDAAQDDSDPSTTKKKKRKTRDNTPADNNSIDDHEGTHKDERKKKKKKDKGKSKDTDTPVELEQQISPTDLDANAQASTAAFLSAIVAAATGSSLDTLTAPSGQMDPHFQPLMFPNNQPFLPFPPMGFNNPLPDPSILSHSMGLPFSDLSFGTNEDVLRALQDLDISKIANVLKTLGEAAAAANVAPMMPMQQPMYYPHPPPLEQYEQRSPQPPPPPTPIGQLPAPSNAILGIPPKKTLPPVDNNTRGDQHTRPDHAELLSTKWLNASKLAELVETEGLIYKKGKFSAIEEQCIQREIKRYQSGTGLSDHMLQDIIFPKGKDKDLSFWSSITRAVPQRPIIAVYHHVRRAYHPLKQQGKWSHEEDALLKQAVTDLGQQWEKVSLRVGRMASDCRDRYRNHIENRDLRVTGPWTTTEEDLLTSIVTDMTVKQGKDIDNDVFWGKVSEMMGGRRGRQQCRIKWTDALSKTVKNEGKKPRWNQQDAFILVHKVDSLNVRDDTEIDWKTLSDPDWNLWSAHTLQRRWTTLKRSVKGNESMTHAEIMDILRVKKAQLPDVPQSPTNQKRKERKVNSNEAITDADTTRSSSENAVARQLEDISSSDET